MSKILNILFLMCYVCVFISRTDKYWNNMGRMCSFTFSFFRWYWGTNALFTGRKGIFYSVYEDPAYCESSGKCEQWWLQLKMVLERTNNDSLSKPLVNQADIQKCYFHIAESEYECSSLKKIFECSCCSLVPYGCAFRHDLNLKHFPFIKKKKIFNKIFFPKLVFTCESLLLTFS